jgi:hypothetical protein
MTDAGSQPASNIPRFDCEDWNEFNVGRRVKNALAYLDFQAHKYRSERWSAERWHYLNGRRLLHDTFLAPVPGRGPQPIPVQFASPTPSLSVFDPGLKLLAAWPRKRLVDELLLTDPKLTDRDLLMRLSQNKLARMLDVAWDSSQRERRRA